VNIVFQIVKVAVIQMVVIATRKMLDGAAMKIKDKD